jgi:hypothetical protein
MSMVRRSVEAGGRRRKSRDALTSRPEIERLLDAARAPASPRELAGEREAVDVFARARLTASAVPLRDDVVVTRSARTGLKAAIASAGAVGLLSSGVAFAATGHVPFAGAISSVTRHVTGQSDEASDHGNGPKGDKTSAGRDENTSSPNGPKAAALQGLCHAFVKGQKATHGHALEQRPFTMLVAAAGGPEQVADFCSALPTKAHQGNPGPTHPTHPTHPTTGPSEDPSSGATHPTHPTHPVHPTKPTHPSSPTHKPKPTQTTHPTHPTKKPHPSQPTKQPHPTHVAH